MHGGATGSGAQRGNQNAFKHGRYGTAALAPRRSIRALLREARDLIDEEQTFEGRRENLNQANKLSRSGPTRATNVRVADVLSFETVNAPAGVLPGFLIDLPPGASVENLEGDVAEGFSFELLLGEIAAGTNRTAIFSALAGVWEFGSRAWMRSY